MAIVAASCVDNLQMSSGVRPTSIVEPRDLFEDLLSRSALRTEVELIAAFGPNYMDVPLTSNPDLIQLAKRSLEHEGRFLGSPYGNELYRVVKIEDAETILRGTWPASLFGDELKAHFRLYSDASVAIMEGDDQRIFFFDREGRFVASYPR